MDQFYKEYYGYVQLFWIKTLLFNIMEHDYVPKHEVLTEQEYVTEVKEVYNVYSKTSLKQINHTDPAARYIGLRPGQVCRITRPSETAGTYIDWRHCKG